MTLLADEWHVARKQHQCGLCLGIIGAGDSYHRQRVVDCRDIYTFKGHTLCEAICLRVAKEIGYWPEDEGFEPHDEIQPGILTFFAAISPPPEVTT
jgi:hypothetical protein